MFSALFAFPHDTSEFTLFQWMVRLDCHGGYDGIRDMLRLPAMLKGFRPHEAFHPSFFRPPSPGVHQLDDHVDAAATLQKMAMPVRHALLEVSEEEHALKHNKTK